MTRITARQRQAAMTSATFALVASLAAWTLVCAVAGLIALHARQGAAFLGIGALWSGHWWRASRRYETERDRIGMLD